VPVYLGEGGFVELKRSSMDKALHTSLTPSDVNVSRKRFSVEQDLGSLITGDRLTIATKDGSTLELVSGHNYSDGVWYINIDPVGGIRLFDTFGAAIDGKKEEALTLVTPSATKEITMQVKNTEYRPLARVREFEFTTNREQVRVESLGEQFKRSYEAGLISGQGSMTCLWESRYAIDDYETRLTVKPEFSFYLASLILRLQQGSDFLGRFFLNLDSATSIRNVWYECEAQITNCSMRVEPSQIIETRVEFVASGDFSLKLGAIPTYLLQESTDYLLIDPDGSKLSLEDEAD
tara:strand:+ start:1461 stop:2336 length:876 start_codon:yes stop_codon:yes gene_type:complete